MKFATDWSNYCGACQQIHEASVDCNGTPIDWAARKVAARAWVHRALAKREPRGSLKGYTTPPAGAGKGEAHE